uniref:Non-lysosomal glucosylceramidase n=1 Tax=Phallusia mammillata TaxID=59560 RepID=A0A6F9DE42_9ASCI|nr:non-lysosomal glucosylceramidase [Phallusia mammillata]
MADQPKWWDQLKNLTLEDNADVDYDGQLMSSYRGKVLGHNVPEFGYKLALSHKFTCHPTAWSYPPLSQVPSLVGLSVRYLMYYKQLREKDKKPCMDFFNQNSLHQVYGVPLGGIGGGTINRGWKGDFCKWQLKPGIYTFNNPLADQFIVTVRRNNKTVYQQVLSVQSPPSNTLKTWNWRFCGDQAYYCGLYPRAWTVYHLRGQNIVLTCQQISPVFPHDYKDTSLPTAVFAWHIQNNNSETVEVSITMSMENGTGCRNLRKSGSGLWHENFTCGVAKGVTMHNNSYPDMPYTMNVTASQREGVNVTQCNSFNPTGDGNEVWGPLLQNGTLYSKAEKSRPTDRGEVTACAVSASCHVTANSSNGQVEFCLAWDMPEIYFGDHQRQYKRRYTRYFGSSGDAGPPIADYALSNYHEWEQKIEQWQQPILSNSRLPAWYKSALFNELYYVTDGGTVWLEVGDEDGKTPNGHDVSSNGNSHSNGTVTHKNAVTSHISEDDIHKLDFFKEYGKFAYLEGQEYKMYNTYDVHFYASIALAHLWPKLELSVQYDIAASILHANPTRRKYLMDGDWAPAKTANVVPHDIGCPDDEPWMEVNTYFVHDTADWRDLNPKFVLQAFRDFYLTKDRAFLQTVWPICKIVMRQSLKHDKDGDGLIENSGGADQTFDGWCVTGPSAYCGGLWIAALRCMIAAAVELDLVDEAEKYSDLLKRATESYQKHLWNGKYFNYDCSSNQRHSTSVMADQCAGQWILFSSGIDDVLPDEQVKSALTTVFKLNVKSYDNGTRGAVNGMRPNGRVDESSVQSNEVWTGVTYALAATMIHKGMIQEAFQTASGIYRTCWQRYGMSYQTPEAFKRSNTFRSLAYMRPLSIWGMQHALECQDSKNE